MNNVSAGKRYPSSNGSRLRVYKLVISFLSFGCSIIFVFLVTALIFGLFALFGYVTNIDLTKIGTYFIIGLFGCIICSIVNIFLHNSTFDLLISIGFVILFIGMTAYDVQKIKYMANNNVIPMENVPIYGALQLYLDFINIFIELLRLFGRRDD